MGNGMKYIIIKGYYCKMPFIFPPAISHDDMYETIKHHGELLSAGYVDGGIVDLMGDLSAHGESTSLGVKSKAEDSEIIMRMLGWNSDI